MHSYGWWWIGTIGAFLFFSGWLGVLAKRGLFGILMDSRRKLSLSRLQLLLWSVLLFSTLVVLAVAKKTVNIDLDANLLALMGISFGGTAGATLIKGVKEGKKPDLGLLNETLRKRNPQTVLEENSSSKDAKLIDMFMGEELLDAKFIDIGKVQMFFITLFILVSYTVTLWAFDFSAMGAKITLPPFSKAMVALIAISHAGYLTVKAAPKTRTQ